MKKVPWGDMRQNSGKIMTARRRRRNMQEIDLLIKGCDVGFETARRIALAVAGQDKEEPMLIAWHDRGRDKHSPGCLQCEIKGAPGWEIYGRNHGGRFRISINNDDYVFICG